MAAKGPGPLRLASRALTQRPPVLTSRRTFLDSVFQANKPLTINVSRTLPYPRAKLYDLIVDVDAYSSFLPYCQHSRVTAWSSPDAGAGGRAWPTEGELTVGFGPITQSYTSRIVCVPGRSIEALSGKQEASVAQKDGAAGRSNPFESLVTKWTVQDAIVKRIGTWSTVDLDLSMRLTDPLVQMMLSGVVDETATKMIDAFEERARALFGDLEG
ncbi:cyclase dehydrase family protein [Diaporthe amygdali]|uniref:cyclase dehydrase family protein n=1 Tax=Phomopsis amygdali TaxID=1214568 RepID=UPI0022FEDA00|nr:cyclase dehydrase family protein [Diaporthe amygdali]KAJ0117035.1 cyclase dehydrase family protein [Diaporthe amygdali]